MEWVQAEPQARLATAERRAVPAERTQAQVAPKAERLAVALLATEAVARVQAEVVVRRTRVRGVDRLGPSTECRECAWTAGRE